MIKQVRNMFILICTIVKLVIARILTWRKNKNDQLYLIGSGYGKYCDDNARVLLNHILEQNYQGYLVVNKVSNKECVLQRGSIKSYCYYFLSTAVFYTHSLSDVLPNAHRVWLILKLFNEPKKIFIQHGVIGLKSRIDDKTTLSQYIYNQSKSFDKMTVTSNLERELVSKFGVTSEKIFVTGLPRFDGIQKYSNTDQVLVFFTWSNLTQYSEKMRELTQSSGYKSLKNNSNMIFIHKHPMMEEYDSDNNGGGLIEKFRNSIKESSLLITDDSSIAWDFFYKNSEVIFFQPSHNWLIQGEYQLEKRTAHTVNELNELIDKFLHSNKRSDFKFARYYDDNNSERVLKLAS